MSRSSIAGAFSLLNSAGLLNSHGNPRAVSLFSFLLKDRSKLSTMCGKLCGKLRKTIKSEPAPMIKSEPPLTIYIGNVEESNTGKAGIACLFQSLTWTDLISGTDSVWVLPPHIDPTHPVLPGLTSKTASMLATYCENEDDVRRWLMQEHHGIATASNPIGFLISAVDKWGSRPGKRNDLHSFFEKKATDAGVRTRQIVVATLHKKSISPHELLESESWKLALIQLREMVEPYDFRHFIQPARGVMTTDGIAIACPDEAHAQWISQEYGPLISKALGAQPIYKAASDVEVSQC